MKEAEQNLKPSVNSCDYEKTFRIAEKDVLTETEGKKCFTLAQNMQKYLCALDLIIEYNRNAHFPLNAEMVIALAFTPLKKSTNVLTIIIKE